ncbi:CLUMA_CG014612, isoform A [Clunio marinus]|uniref:CLUMA_CG014612, isoform A n=1 Tax=Clunio marinus TaxID=568069 RepID=A0A1J1IM54_9DIPT|nr:CLUMA_CG014612, isoform A [Clunio marinus]
MYKCPLYSGTSLNRWLKVHQLIEAIFHTNSIQGDKKISVYQGLSVYRSSTVLPFVSRDNFLSHLMFNIWCGGLPC